MLNGTERRLEVPPRKLLLDAIREDAGLTGAHAGCEQGVCGACTILLDGLPVRSCLMFAVQAEGCEVATVEGLEANGALHPLQQAFIDHMGFQCGFCTSAMLLTAVAYLREHPDPDREEVRRAIFGNLCRCTGYEDIVTSILTGAEAMRSGSKVAA